MRKQNSNHRKLNELLTQGKIIDFFSLMEAVASPGFYLMKELQMAKLRFENLFKSSLSGTIRKEEEKIEYNSLISGLLEVVRKMEDSDFLVNHRRDPLVIHDPIERTSRVIEGLNQLQNTPIKGLNEVDIRSNSFLSIFAVTEQNLLDHIVSDDENYKKRYARLLLQEQAALRGLLEQGYKLNCTIAPAGANMIRVKDASIALSRTEALIHFIEKNRKSGFMRNIEWAVSDHETENVYIIGDNLMFEGKKYGQKVGYNKTIVVEDYDSIRHSIYLRQIQFKEHTRYTSSRWGKVQKRAWDSHDLMLDSILRSLEESQQFLEREISKMQYLVS